MAEEIINLEVVTPLKLAIETKVSEMSAPSVDGEFGVLPGHRPLLAALKHGPVKYLEGNKAKIAAVGPGFAEVGPDRVVLLVEHYVPAEEIDIEEVEDELARAQDKKKELQGQETTAEYDEVTRDERWAEVKLEVAKRLREI